MPEKKKKKYRAVHIITEAKKIPPPEPFRVTKPERIGLPTSRRRQEVRIAPPPEPTRKVKPKKVKKGEG